MATKPKRPDETLQGTDEVQSLVLEALERGFHAGVRAGRNLDDVDEDLEEDDQDE